MAWHQATSPPAGRLMLPCDGPSGPGCRLALAVVGLNFLRMDCVHVWSCVWLPGLCVSRIGKWQWQ
eukprot:11192495-Lingulodinium_polyedra.AAC.1